MRNLFALLFFFQISEMFSQTWFDAGVKGGYGLNLLYNENFFKDNNFTPKLSYGYLYGGKIGFNFNEYHSVTFDFTPSVFNQNFSYSVLNADSTRNSFSRSIGFSSFNFLLMYRKLKAASYVEIGPQYSMITKTTGKDNLMGSIDVSQYMVKSFYSVAAGFGGFVMGSENFGVLFGVRFSYALNDLISKTGQQVNFPSTISYGTYKPSNPFAAIMVLEMNYDLGYLAKAKCGKKTKFLMF